jgi:uncharacterized Zn finger protein
MWGRPWFERSRPRQARGGIKAQSQRGAFGETWWAKRWIDVLESFRMGARLHRGRTYARQGQVLSIDVSKGLVRARVQGSRPNPYDVTIRVKLLSRGDWKKLAKELSHQALFAAKLLAGEMPQDIEKAFTAAGLSLFPKKLGDLDTDCSCPDPANPCKHIAAVYYLLGEEFDRDPFLLFKLRGLEREELLKLLGESGAAPAPSGPAAAEEPAPAPAAAEPLPADAAGFWHGGDLTEDLYGSVSPPPVTAYLLQRLGNFPFWRGEQRFRDALEPVYKQASQRGLQVFLGEEAGR